MISMLMFDCSIVAEHLGKLDGVRDRGDRIPELVGEHRQELVLAPVRPGELGQPSLELRLQPLPLRDVANDAGEEATRPSCGIH